MQAIIKLLCNYNFYLKYNNIIYKYIKDNKELCTIYNYISLLMNKYQDNISIEVLSLYILSQVQEKEKEIYKNILEEIRKESIDSVIIEDLILELSKKHQAYELSKLALDVSEGYKSFDDLLLFTQNLNASTDLVDPSTGHSIVTDDLDELYNTTYSTTGLRWRCSSLNKSLGSLRKGDFGFIFARPESFSRDTEVLTPHGWVTVDKVTNETYISQVNPDLTTTFVRPTAIHPHEQSHCYHIHDKIGRVDLIVTEGHGMIYEKEGKLWKERADSVKYYQGVKHHVSAPTSVNTKVTFMPEHRLAIAYQADGHTRNYKEYGYTFSFTKERKQQRLKEILDDCGYEYSEYKDGNNGHLGYYVKSKIRLYKHFDWINLALISKEWCQQFIEELSYWDSTRRTNSRFKFDTINRSVADKVQAIAILAGYNCLLSIHIDDRSPNYSDVYSLSIRTNYQPVDGQCIVKERISFKDTTYCFEVSSGMLLVRRNGAVAISGNTGKTTFLASEVSYFAEQCDSPILWFNNEEQGSKVKLRIYQASLGIGLTELLNNRDKYGKQFFDKTARKIILNDAANTTKNDVQRLIELYQPGCIVFDQLDKIQGFSGDREDIRLGNIYIWARNIAKQYCPVIGVCQADATGEGKRWLTMDNVASAKTTKQAEADWIIGIGKTHNENEEYFRYLSICKNKLLGDEDTDPILRHGHLTVKINPYIARYED